MPASAVAGHQIADRGLARPVEDAVTDGGYDAVVRRTPMHAQRDVRVRKKRVDQKPIARRKPLDLAQIGDDDVVQLKTVALEEVLEILLLAPQAIDALLYFRLLEHLLDGHRLQPFDELVKVSLELTETGAAVDGVAQEDVVAGVVDVVG